MGDGNCPSGRSLEAAHRTHYWVDRGYATILPDFTQYHCQAVSEKFCPSWTGSVQTRCYAGSPEAHIGVLVRQYDRSGPDCLARYAGSVITRKPKPTGQLLLLRENVNKSFLWRERMTHL